MAAAARGCAGAPTAATGPEPHAGMSKRRCRQLPRCSRLQAVVIMLSMNASQILVAGTLKPDGTLELRERPMLPPGPVEVLIRAQPAPAEGGETWWEYLQAARAELLAQGQT